MDWVIAVPYGAAALTAVVAYGLSFYRFKLRLAERDLAIQKQQGEDQLQMLEAQAELKSRHSELLGLQQRYQQQSSSLLQEQQLSSKKSAHIAKLSTELEQQRLATQREIQLLNDARKQLSKEFENLANRIFDEKSDRFTQSSQNTLNLAINPLKQQLSDFKQKVDDVYDKDSRDRSHLLAELGQLKKLNLQMSDDALNLTRALKGDNKAQGNWGEVILERVLEESGLRKGFEYETQVNLSDSEGRRRSPDVIIRLPENKDIIVDAKVSLVDYERLCSSDNETEKQQALKQHAASIRGHIRGLSVKAYENLESVRSLDFVFIFIPIESAFMAAFEYDQSMFQEAYEKNIIVVGPTTLLATLRTVQSIWRYERQNKNAEEIARQAGAMHDKFVSFFDDMEKIERHLEQAAESHRLAMNKLSIGRGSLVGRTIKLEELGAKVKKKMPVSVKGESTIQAHDK